MAKKIDKKLVVDASVANSAGMTDHPISKSCRDTLICILCNSYILVMTKNIYDEWKNHMSRFSITWLSSMTARKRILRVDLEQYHELREKLERVELTDKDKEAMMKDVHLVEAALKIGQIIISGDDTARGLFKIASRRVGEIRHIIWVNPIYDDERVIPWLDDGASHEKYRCLGHEADEP